MERALAGGCPSVSRVGTCRGRLLAGVTKLSVMPGPTHTNDPSHLGLSPAAAVVVVVGAGVQ